MNGGDTLMTSGERIIPGCGSYDSFTGVCRIMFRKGAGLPSLAKETLIDPPGAIEGPPSSGVNGLVCTATNKPELQKDCSNFIVRTATDDLRDESI